MAKSGTPAPKQTIVAIKVKFELNSKDGLRRIQFGLEKDTEGDTVTWKINFALFERAKRTDPYADALVMLDVQVDSKLNSRAEETAKSGLTAGQAAHALGPAADDVKGTTTGEVSPEDAQDTVQSTLKKK
jgi:hypothetical protein